MFDRNTAFDVVGYLSPDMRKFIDDCRRMHAIWFQLDARRSETHFYIFELHQVPLQKVFDDDC